MENKATHKPKAGIRQWIGLAVLALPTLILAIETSVVYLALPRLSSQLGADNIEQLWIIDIYGFMLASLLITMGSLGDRIGRRKLLLIGASAFGAASAVASFAPNTETLIAARALMGIAGASLMPSTLALISNMFHDAKQRGMAIGLWMSCFMIGMIVGPLVGGILLENFWWGSVFLVGVPIMLLLLAVAPFLLPEYRNSKAGQIDLRSVALSLGTILLFVYGLKESVQHGVGPTSLVTIAAGIGMGMAFIRRQRTLEHPLMDVRLFSNQAFTATVSAMLVVAVLMGGVSFLVAQYLQLVMGLSPLQAGLWSIPQAAGMLIMSIISPLLAQRFKPVHIIAAGLLSAATGFAFLGFTPIDHGLTTVVAGFVLATAGVAPTLVLGTGLVMNSAPAEKAGSAAAISETSNQLGVALGIALFGSLGAVIYHGQISENIPSGLPVQTVNTASESLVGATSAAQQLQSPASADLLAAAHSAFTSGLTFAAIVGSTIFILLAIIVLSKLRNKNE